MDGQELTKMIEDVKRRHAEQKLAKRKAAGQTGTVVVEFKDGKSTVRAPYAEERTRKTRPTGAKQRRSAAERLMREVDESVERRAADRALGVNRGGCHGGMSTAAALQAHKIRSDQLQNESQ